jgi:hypothetical protein
MMAVLLAVKSVTLALITVPLWDCDYQINYLAGDSRQIHYLARLAVHTWKWDCHIYSYLLPDRGWPSNSLPGTGGRREVDYCTAGWPSNLLSGTCSCSLVAGQVIILLSVSDLLPYKGWGSILLPEGITHQIHYLMVILSVGGRQSSQLYWQRLASNPLSGTDSCPFVRMYYPAKSGRKIHYRSGMHGWLGCRPLAGRYQYTM